jgi:metal-responsive CopG/Arc/MetJ family transcriptional regulator
MQRYNFFFPKELMKEFKKISEETGAPISELLRRAAREYLEKRTLKKSKDLLLNGQK